MNLIYKALEYSREFHDKIKEVRKYTEDPYWFHTNEVLTITSGHSNKETVIAAAGLHDIFESADTYKYFGDARKEVLDIFGSEVTKLVTELTDVYTSENYPKLNRAKRKELECERLAKISDDGKLIKLADIYSNTKDIVLNDINFGRVYLSEKRALLPLLMTNSNQILAARVWAQLEKCEKFV